MKRRMLPRIFLVLAPVVAAALAVACLGEDPPTGSEGRPDGAVDLPGADAAQTGRTDAGALEDGRAPTEVDAEAGPAATFCDTQPTPVVPKTSTFCADFDDPDRDAGWTSTFLSDGGKLERTTVAARSTPASLLADSPLAGTGPRGGTLSWLSTGATNAKTISVRAYVRPLHGRNVVPPQTGSVELVTVGISGGATLGLRYTSGATVDGTAGYTGYYLSAIYTNGGAISEQARVPSQNDPAVGQWTEMKLDITTSANGAGNMTLYFNNVLIVSKSPVPAYPGADVTVSVGNRAVGANSALTAHYYDDVRVEIVRE